MPRVYEGGENFARLLAFLCYTWSVSGPRASDVIFSKVGEGRVGIFARQTHTLQRGRQGIVDSERHLRCERRGGCEAVALEGWSGIRRKRKPARSDEELLPVPYPR